MGDSVMTDEYPDARQRRAVCQRQLDSKEAVTTDAVIFEGVVSEQRDAIRDVVILRDKSLNGRTYLREARRQAVADGIFEGARVYFNHDDRGAMGRRVEDLCGVIEGVRLVGDDFIGAQRIRLVGTAENKQKAAELAEDAGKVIGLSWTGQAAFVQEAGQMVVTRIVGVRSVDIVPEPAATRNLHESAEPEGLQEGPIRDRIEADKEVEALMATVRTAVELMYRECGDARRATRDRVRKAREITADLYRELGALGDRLEVPADSSTGDSIESSTGDDDVDIKALTVEQLRGERPDLVEALTRGASETAGAQIDRLGEQLKEANARLEEAEARLATLSELEAKAARADQFEARRQAETEVDKLLADSKFPANWVTASFREQLIGLPTAEARQMALEDRRLIMSPRPTSAANTEVIEGADPGQLSDQESEQVRRLAVA